MVSLVADFSCLCTQDDEAKTRPPKRGAEKEDEFQLIEVCKEEGERLKLVEVNDFDRMNMVKGVDAEKTICEEDCKRVSAALPPRFKRSSWEEVYNSARNGFSPKVFFKTVEKVKESILVVRDSADNIFGAFTTDGYKKTDSFYGSGETFLFNICRETNQLHSYLSAGENNSYIHVASSGAIYFGGPVDSSPTVNALYIAPNLQGGTTAACPTFANPPLVTHTPKDKDTFSFEIRSISVFSLSVFDTIEYKEYISVKTVS
eukprot:TRINITY_DN25048_c0_g1_i1.p1 TRINITY_DN25048_c0_g1~~TRINITY_DN25048_c0_g1_i1.p1  ORF type:complete len:260 (+),score=45.85 TRINITY_DN25048_c0_g1_i1:55-834(+)